MLAIVFDCKEESFFFVFFCGGTMIWTEPTAKDFV